MIETSRGVQSVESVCFDPNAQFRKSNCKTHLWEEQNTFSWYVIQVSERIYSLLIQLWRSWHFVGWFAQEHIWLNDVDKDYSILSFRCNAVSVTVCAAVIMCRVRRRTSASCRCDISDTWWSFWVISGAATFQVITFTFLNSNKCSVCLQHTSSTAWHKISVALIHRHVSYIHIVTAFNRLSIRCRMNKERSVDIETCTR
jgi:hypothetical protein